MYLPRQISDLDFYYFTELLESLLNVACSDSNSVFQSSSSDIHSLTLNMLLRLVYEWGTFYFCIFGTF